MKDGSPDKDTEAVCHIQDSEMSSREEVDFRTAVNKAMTELSEQLKPLLLECPHPTKDEMMVSSTRFGLFFKVEEGALFTVPMRTNYAPESGFWGIKWEEVTAPVSQDFLDTVNKAFDTDFQMGLGAFAGR